jgi:alanine racemase
VIRPTVARVNLSAIQSNLRAIVDLLKGKARVIAVVKANAYGHGAARVGAALEAGSVDMLACADIEEGILLREAGVRAPILVFGALSVSDLAGVFDHGLTPTISTPSAARALQAAAQARGVRLTCHLKIDTGMNRLGLRHDNLAATIPEIAASPNLQIVAAYTHFATADDPESPFMTDQRERFERSLTQLSASGLGPLIRHAANSAAFLRDERAWYDFIRPGLLLYGIAPPPLATTLRLEPALTLTSKVVAVKGMRPGEGTGYGLPTRADGPRSIAVVPAGYADGLDTRLAGRGAVLIRGRRAPIIGSVCMDMITADVTELAGDAAVHTGDEVTIIGQQGDQRIDAREMAAAIGTIPYEILCRIGARIERVYT